ncbi:MAG: hypothetical protein FJ295_21250 [Planctomycetes bacterium]|nr:hypothetical protein [Planctomycetota bacterium]
MATKRVIRQSRIFSSRPSRFAMLCFGFVAGVIAGLIWWNEKRSMRVDVGPAVPDRQQLGDVPRRSDGLPADPVSTASERRKTASAIEGQAELLADAGKVAESLEEYVRAFSLRMELLEADPLDVESRTQLAVSAHQLHALAIDQLHDYVLAEWHAREHFRSVADFLDREPDLEMRWRREYFRALLDLGEALQRQGDFEGAEIAGRKAIAWFEQQQAGADPADSERLDLMRAWIVLGESELNLNRGDDAARSLNSASELGAGRFGDGPYRLDADMLRLRNCLALAFVALHREDLSSAARWLEMAFGISDALRESGMNSPLVDAGFPSSGLKQIATAAHLRAQPNEPDGPDGGPVSASSDREAVESAQLFLQCLRWLRHGETSDAREALHRSQQQMPHASLLRIADAMVACNAAAATNDALEKSARLEEAWDGVASALDLDPALARILHLTPELAALRSQPAFAERLRDRFATPRNSDP